MTNPAAKLTLAWRIGVSNYERDAAFHRLLELLRQNRSIVDEVSLFETVTHHLYIPPEALAQRMALIGRRLVALREVGVPSVGINVLTTMGHINEGWDYMPALPFQPMIGHDGAASLGCACPNTPELRQYVWDKYQMAAGEKPDFIWIDDDIRMQGHGVAYACFCPTCLGIFADSTGTALTREELVAALSDPQRADLRQAWVAQNVETLERLLAHVAAAIRDVDPAIETGLMTAGPGWTTYSGQAHGRWMTALGAGKARPGGGFYTDDVPRAMLLKGLEAGRQAYDAPEQVSDIQYELENFPYQTLRKAAASVVNECTVALACGLNGIAFNALGMGEGDFADYRPLLRRVHHARPVWEAVVSHCAGLPTRGLWTAWSPQLMARREVRANEDWFATLAGHDTTRGYVLGEIGLPLCSDPNACGTVLTGRAVEGFTDDELRRMLAGALLTDGVSLEVLERRGLADLTGVRIARRVTNGVIERFTDELLNEGCVNATRDCRVEFWGDATGQADVLEATAEGVCMAATMENYFGESYGPCLSVFENSLGGRVAVLGYSPWMFIHSSAKRRQLQNIADWLTRGALPVRIDEPVSLTPLVRLSESRDRGAVLLLNTGLDRIETATVHVRATGSLRAIDESGEREVQAMAEATGWEVKVSTIAPWEAVWLLVG